MILQPFRKAIRAAATTTSRATTTTARDAAKPLRPHGLGPTTTTTTATKRFATKGSHYSTTTVVHKNSWSESTNTENRPVWSEEWKRLGLGATLVDDDDDDSSFPTNLFFVQLGFGVDQHGDRSNGTKAAIRAVRNAIEFNSIPGVIDHIPGGRKEMLIHVKLGVPKTATVDPLEVAKVFPYGRLLPIEMTTGGLEFHSGRVVEELGDEDDVGICCVACVSIGYNKDKEQSTTTATSTHKTYNTKDGY